MTVVTGIVEKTSTVEETDVLNVAVGVVEDESDVVLVEAESVGRK